MEGSIHLPDIVHQSVIHSVGQTADNNVIILLIIEVRNCQCQHHYWDK